MSDTAHVLNLYYAPSSCSLAPHILLRASELPFKLTQASVIGGIDPELVKLNPKKQVPFIELEPGVILTEIPAIVTAISQLAPEKKFLGDSNIEILRSYEWMNYLSGQVHARRFGVLFRPQRYVDDEKLYPMVKGMAMEAIREAFQFIEEKLKELKPVDAANFRAVDAHLFVYFRWANAFGIDMQKDFPRYNERMIEVSKLEPVIKAVEVEGIKLLGV